MNEVDLVRGLLREPPPPSPRTTEQALRRLKKDITGPRRRTSRPGRRWFAVGLAAAGTAAAVAVAATVTGDSDAPVPPRSSRPVQLSAQEILLSAASSTAKAPVTSGGYWLTSEQQGTAVVVGRPSDRYVIESRMLLKQWVGIGRRPSWQATRELGARPQGEADRAAWRRAGSPTRWTFPPPFTPWTSGASRWKTERLPVQLTFTAGSVQDVQRLPDDPAQLRTYFMKRKNDSEGDSSPTEWLFSSAYDVLLSEPASAKVRAAAYRILAELPGVRSVGRTTDPLGRPGVAVALGDGAPSDQPSTEDRIVVDPATGALLAEETVLVRPATGRAVSRLPSDLAVESARPGTILNYRALLTATWTDTAP
ncbi:CU044_5270 family protein [Actinoallomurus sp. NPDC052308]|uniref:CU044_5270 family protein n=1 Tax=Actinoallomurus sp. NPDC052308 TaxID=3155530 RepID=UPI0034450FC5